MHSNMITEHGAIIPTGKYGDIVTRYDIKKYHYETEDSESTKKDT